MASRGWSDTSDTSVRRSPPLTNTTASFSSLPCSSRSTGAVQQRADTAPTVPPPPPLPSAEMPARRRRRRHRAVSPSSPLPGPAPHHVPSAVLTPRGNNARLSGAAGARCLHRCLQPGPAGGVTSEPARYQLRRPALLSHRRATRPLFLSVSVRAGSGVRRRPESSRSGLGREPTRCSRRRRRCEGRRSASSSSEQLMD